MDWLPISAAALLTGATALFFGAQMIPRPRGDGELLRSAQTEGDTLLVVAILLNVAAIGLVIGLPALFTLFQRKGFRTGLFAAVLMAVGAVMLAGFAQQLLFFHSLAEHDAITEQTITAVADNELQRVLLGGGFAIFYLGEFVLALALVRARSTPLWVPWFFIIHVVLVAVALRFMPEAWQGAPAVFMTAAFVGVGISANRTGRL